MKKEPTRYQECSWPVRLWRRRHYLRIPYMALNVWLDERKREPEVFQDEYGSFTFGPMSFKDCWGLATGLVQSDMHWWYTQEEVWAHLDVMKEKWFATKK